jgi:N-acetylmuramoyl-L-alanine amidase
MLCCKTASEFARQLAERGPFPRRSDPQHRRVHSAARSGRTRPRVACRSFLSIHADALPNSETRELSVFALSTPASDREAAALAISENRANLVGGISLSRQPREVETILMDLWRRQTENFAIALACSMSTRLAREVVLLDRPRRFADLLY